LNYMLINYVDMKYDHIWSNDYIKKKKQEIKENSPYYRIVKQGSQLVYISFHIFTIYVVLLMACMRQSIISLGYVLILLPRMKDGSEVLDQRNMNQNSAQNKLQEEIDEIASKLQEMSKSGENITKEEV
jgi:parvulin-like peptidyl-prolyl isomerase